MSAKIATIPGGTGALWVYLSPLGTIYGVLSKAGNDRLLGALWVRSGSIWAFKENRFGDYDYDNAILDVSAVYPSGDYLFSVSVPSHSEKVTAKLNLLVQAINGSDARIIVARPSATTIYANQSFVGGTIGTTQGATNYDVIAENRQVRQIVTPTNSQQVVIGVRGFNIRGLLE